MQSNPAAVPLASTRVHHDAPHAVTAGVRGLLETTAKVRRRVLVAALQRLSVHRRQSTGIGVVYMELCPAYLQTMVGCCYETARQVWQALRAVVRWDELSLDQARRLGVRTRRLEPGRRYGRHMLVECRAVDAITDLLADEGLSPAGRVPDEQLEWRSVQPLGNGGKCRCPHHDDRHASMALDHDTGTATCFVCRESYRFDPVGLRVAARPAAKPRPGVGGYPLYYSAPGAPRHRPRGAFDGWWSATLDRRGTRPRVVPGVDLLGLVRRRSHSNRRIPSGLASLVKSCPMGDRRDLVADQLAYVDHMTVDGKRRGRWHRVAGEERYILVDVDDIDPNIDDVRTGVELRRVGEQLERWAQGRSWLSGRVALTQTSLRGVQALLELSEGRAPGWRVGDGAPRCEEAESEVLRLLDEAGYIEGVADPTARDGGRLCRLPGARVDKDGRLYLSRARYITEDP